MPALAALAYGLTVISAGLRGDQPPASVDLTIPNRSSLATDGSKSLASQLGSSAEGLSEQRASIFHTALLGKHEGKHTQASAGKSSEQQQ